MVVVLGCLTHCLGMAIHRNGHEEMSLFLAADRLPRLLEGLYEEPESHDRPGRGAAGHHLATAPTASRCRSRPASCGSPTRSTWPRAAHASRSSRGRVSIHSLSAAAIEGVRHPRRPRQGADRDRDEQLRRPLPGRQPAASRSCAAPASRSYLDVEATLEGDVREAPAAVVPAVSALVPPPGGRIPLWYPYAAFAGSSNGRTPDSGSGSRGSSPCPAARVNHAESGRLTRPCQDARRPTHAHRR